MKSLRPDHGGEDMSQRFTSFLDEKDILRDAIITHNPLQNGVAERLNRTLVDLVRGMLHYKGVKKPVWAEALAVAVHVRNRVTFKPHSSNVTPFELWTGNKPDVSDLWVFGCKCFYLLKKMDVDQINPTASKMILLDMY